MTAVWIFQGNHPAAFSDSAFIEPSLRITYSTIDCSLYCTFDGSARKTFEVRKPRKIGEPIGELIERLEFRLCEILTGPDHL